MLALYKDVILIVLRPGANKNDFRDDVCHVKNDNKQSDNSLCEVTTALLRLQTSTTIVSFG